MKKILTILMIAIGVTTSAQTYVSGSFSVFNGTGTFCEKAMPTLEVGRTVADVLSLGAAVGRTSFSGEGKMYTEFRPTLTVFSKNGFSASGTFGVGYIFNSSQNFLTEYCGTISSAISPSWSFSIFAGGYKFEGKNTSSKYTFVGTGITYSIPRLKPGK